MGASEIDPRGVYSAREVCRLIPSARAGHLHLATFHRWRIAGRIKAFKIGKSWFCHGAEILRLLHADEAQVFTGRAGRRPSAAGGSRRPRPSCAAWA